MLDASQETNENQIIDSSYQIDETQILFTS